ncbi:alpha/beta hydrolase [Alicyclobacillus tolerans]|uniref:alpha/beta fold hydrolase n=1 Tax=Alicyclobacillus tolerans TaxID=90970 RepID=UPI001F3F30C3|nr:alpha/beta hydrolase [Alicyclobacillus tolerans]MCF8564106.1 alpha/beta hydrolase [Alicyclobacillus tolerans]
MFCTVQGEKVFYEHIGNADSEVKLLFVHGASSYGMFWLPLIARLRSYDCIVLDLPGHYRSLGQSKSEISEYAVWMEEFAAQLGVDSLTYVGHSLGGAIGIELALAKAPWLKSLVLLNTAGKLDVSADFLDKLSKGVYNEAYFIEQGFGSAAKASLKRVVSQNTRVDTRSSYRDFLAASKFNRQKDVSRITLPTLIIAGEQDKVTPPVGSVALNESIAQSRLVVISNSGHFTPLENAREVSLEIRDFLNAHRQHAPSYAI